MTMKGLHYWTKDEMGAIEDVEFTITRVDSGPYTATVTGKKIRLGGNVYAYVLKIIKDGTGFTVSSAGNKHFTITFPTAFTTLYGGAANAALSGNTDCYVGNTNIRSNEVSIWITSDSDGGDITLSCFVVGEIVPS